MRPAEAPRVPHRFGYLEATDSWV